MKTKVLVIALSLCMVLAMMPMTVSAATYSDTDGHWAESHIDRWSQYGIVNGKGGSTFDPNGLMTRGEAAKVFAELFGLKEKADISGFADVDADDWYADAIAMCVAAGIMNGTSDTSLDPDGYMSREMFFTMFARALGIKPEATNNKDFDDHHEVSDWAEGYVNALINGGYVSGMTEDTIEPDLNINRASVMTLLHKTVKHYVTEEGTTVDAADLADGGIILVVADDVKIENAPEGSVIVTAPETTGTVANGTKIEEDTFHEIVEEAPVVSGGGGGGRPSIDDTQEVNPGSSPKSPNNTNPGSSPKSPNANN